MYTDCYCEILQQKLEIIEERSKQSVLRLWQVGELHWDADILRMYDVIK